VWQEDHKQDSCPTLSPAVYDTIPMATINMCAYFERPQNLKNTYLSMLVPPGSLLVRKSLGMESAIYVLGTNANGVLGWKCKMRLMPEGKVLIELDFSNPAHGWKVATVCEENLEDCVSNEVKVLCPALAKSILPGVDGVGIRLVSTRASSGTLLQVAARTGFRHLTVALMKQLYKFLEVPHKGKAPNTEDTICFALVKHVYHDKSEEEIRAMVAARGSRRPPAVEPTIESHDVDEVAQGFGEDEEDMVRHELKALPSVKKNAAAGAGGKGSRGSKREPARPVKKMIDLAGELTPDIASTFLPDVPGCRIIKDLKLHMRWQVSYPSELPPHTTSKAIGVAGDQAALMFCLKWAWDRHSDQTGELCPWEL
jgi:hypothetical protein